MKNPEHITDGGGVLGSELLMIQILMKERQMRWRLRFGKYWTASGSVEGEPNRFTLTATRYTARYMDSSPCHNRISLPTDSDPEAAAQLMEAIILGGMEEK